VRVIETPPPPPVWHTLYPVRSDEGVETVAAFASEGFARGERVALVLERNVREAVGDRLADTGTTPNGALRMWDVADVYGAEGRIDPEPQLATFRGMLQEALAEGYSGLRVAGDVTPVALRHPNDLLRWERTADAFEARSPVTGMCVIDARSVEPDLLRTVDVLHPASAYSTAPFHMHAGPDASLALTGELDVFDVDLMSEAIGPLRRDVFEAEPVLDLSGATYVTHQALQSLDRFAAEIGVTIELRNGPAIVARLVSTIGLERLEVIA
jgi:MEDS: MEthanogen/methylotroph, DcmR Sensory domain